MSRALEVVVVGNGMVGHRLAQEVRRRDPGGVRVRLTIVGDEPTGGYNRVLLPGLIAGSLTEADLAPDEDGNSFAPDEGGKPLAPDEARKAAPGGVRGGTTVTRVDRAERTVTTADGHQLPYDRLVLATGAHANIPPLPGLRRDDGAPARDVSALRTLADARRLRRLAHRARARGAPMAVLGGGILGLEAARALVARGVGVTVVHQATHVMDRQLDAPAGRVLARSLLRTGIAQRLGVAATAWVPEEGLHLADGSVVPAAGLLLSTGARPRTALAQECGLAVGPAGIAVDDALTTSDPDVYALGDCADADPGLVQPGWEQAATLAALLTGDNPQARYVGTPRVTRLKAAGIELACLGDPFAEPHEAAAPVSDEAAPLLPGPAAPQDPRGSAPRAGPRHQEDPRPRTGRRRSARPRSCAWRTRPESATPSSSCTATASPEPSCSACRTPPPGSSSSSTGAPRPPPTGSPSCWAGPCRPRCRAAPSRCPTTGWCAAATASPRERCAPPGTPGRAHRASWPTRPAPPPAAAAAAPPSRNSRPGSPRQTLRSRPRPRPRPTRGEPRALHSHS